MKIKLVNKKEEAKDTWSFYFEPEKVASRLPGQFYYFTLPKLKYADSKGPTRHFTISNSPTEGDLLQITTRIRANSGFKKTLIEQPIGSTIEVEGPDGTYIFDENEKKSSVFIAGGIGITPFRVFLKYNIDKNLKLPMHLIYSNSNQDEITFREELTNWSKAYPFIKLDMTITQPQRDGNRWSGLQGRIDENMIKTQVEDHRNKTYWIAGPPQMVDAIEKNLDKLKLRSGNIRSEKFTGY